MFYDDFFYYAAVARSYLQVGLTTFDGQTHTNGYHPAWLMLLVEIMRFSGKEFLYVTAVVVCVLMAISTFLLSRLLRIFGVCSSGSILCTLVTVGLMIPVFGRGMESVLVAPVLLCFCLFAQKTRFDHVKEWFLLGLLGSFMILSRIDAAIFLVLYVSFLSFQERRSGKALARLFATGVGLSPAVVYFIYNRIVFGAFMTVSSKAKELRVTHLPSLLPLSGATHSVLVVLYLTSVIGLGVYFVSGPGRIRRPLALAALLFPFVQLVTLCFISDWPLEPWYSYNLILSFPVAVCIVFRPVAAPVRHLFRARGFVGLVAGVLFVTVLQVARARAIRHDSIGIAAEKVADWSKGHPGSMAMGDRAGKVGWTMYPGPLQLEGIMADMPFLEHVRRQEDLRSVLKLYGVRYYVATNLPLHNGCYTAVEPSRAGKTVKTIRSEFCSAPVFVYVDAPGPGEVTDVVGPNPVTMIFDVGQN